MHFVEPQKAARCVFHRHAGTSRQLAAGCVESQLIYRHPD